mgnify:FL=1
MSNLLFRPFDRYNFSESVCYLTGDPSISKITVFPEWLIKQYKLEDKPFKMLDERILTYTDITVPASEIAIAKLELLEIEIRNAFNSGYEAVSQLDELKLFQWMAKQVYGIIHWEVRAGIRQQRAMGEDFNFSQSIAHKFSNLHIMLQSLVQEMEFEGILPWSIKVFPLKNAPETFSYRDEINTLVFSLKMNDFGIVACLQDNGESLSYHKSILDKIGNSTLHPVQYEEVCARFFYSAYLFNRLPEYTVLSANGIIYIDAMPLRISSRPVYDTWQGKTYGQVLENFWKAWGFTLFEIIKDPDHPMSFLLNEEGDFNNTVDLPLQ